jgi:4-diphosphocytidyl-2-C-methyl-D-erythritol kinase
LKGVCALLIHPGFGVATAWAYQALAQFPYALAGKPERAQALVHQLQHGSLEAASTAFYNSLEAPVFSKYPILSIYQEFLRERGALATLMSGSGSTTFALIRNEAFANELAAEFKARFGSHCWTAVSALNAS